MFMAFVTMIYSVIHPIEMNRKAFVSKVSKRKRGYSFDERVSLRFSLLEISMSLDC